MQRHLLSISFTCIGIALGVAIVHLASQLHDAETKIRKLKDDNNSERKGRTEAHKQLREVVQSKVPSCISLFLPSCPKQHPRPTLTP